MYHYMLIELLRREQAWWHTLVCSSTLGVETGGSGAESLYLVSSRSAWDTQLMKKIYRESGGDGLVGKGACCTIMST